MCYKYDLDDRTKFFEGKIRSTTISSHPRNWFGGETLYVKIEMRRAEHSVKLAGPGLGFVSANVAYEDASCTLDSNIREHQALFEHCLCGSLRLALGGMLSQKGTYRGAALSGENFHAGPNLRILRPNFHQDLRASTKFLPGDCRFFTT